MWNISVDCGAFSFPLGILRDLFSCPGQTCVHCRYCEICVALGMWHCMNFVSICVSFYLLILWWWYCWSHFMGEKIETPEGLSDLIKDTLMVYSLKPRTVGLWNACFPYAQTSTYWTWLQFCFLSLQHHWHQLVAETGHWLPGPSLQTPHLWQLQSWVLVSKTQRAAPLCTYCAILFDVKKVSTETNGGSPVWGVFGRNSGSLGSCTWWEQRHTQCRCVWGQGTYLPPFHLRGSFLLFRRLLLNPIP